MYKPVSPQIFQKNRNNITSNIDNYIKSKKYTFFLLIFLSYIIFFNYIKTEKNIEINQNTKEKNNKQESKLIEENFFIIDSDNLEQIESHMYGFCVSKKGILTDNYYKEQGHYERPESQGVYIMIIKKGNELRLFQDYYGNFGLYFYENKNTKYFALSNSYLLLLEHLIGKQKLTFNKDYADNLIISVLYTPSINETLIKEISKLPSSIIININIQKKKFKIFHINYHEKEIPFESQEALEIIDKWVDKWGFIIRSLKKQTDNISFDLTGGFDTRSVLSVLLNSNIDLREVLIHSINDNKSVHQTDFQIANNISYKYGFKLNNFTLDDRQIKWNLQDSLNCEYYTRLGFHKGFILNNKFYRKPRFTFTGSGGEHIRGYPGKTIQEYFKKLTLNSYEIKGHEKEFYKSSVRIFNRSIDSLKKNNCFNNDYEIASSLYIKGPTINHYGKSALESFLKNCYSLQPMMDPELKKIKFNISGNLPHDFVSYIYIRFAPDLIYFPFEGKRILNIKSIDKAYNLSRTFKPYEKKKDYNSNFYIDKKRKSPAFESKYYENDESYLKNLFKSPEFINIIHKVYDNNVYNWAQEYINKSNHIPFRHDFGLLAIAKTLDYLSLNQRYFGKIFDKSIFKKKKIFP